MIKTKTMLKAKIWSGTNNERQAGTGLWYRREAGRQAGRQAGRGMWCRQQAGRQAGRELWYRLQAGCRAETFHRRTPGRRWKK